ncbi:c-type cytochrome [Pararhizobium haloflavum]|uniref:c-type cytochrome n=1 Tax=Pararhizobium haloflavum TaxID=2037914 RepID=UPI001FE0AC30|nr:c-type cytochrome [Pararhizobium haloflavum]
MHIRWKHVAIALAILPFAAVFAVWTGLFNVGAASGHWKITDWFLHFAMQSSVRTYALPVEVPEPLPREGLAAAAGHFETGCAVCHSSPDVPRDAWARQMLPEPPALSDVLASDKWTDAELFRIVKHGVRFTGMPAWPTQDRDDEIWAMVAFLREMPDLDAKAYRDLAYGPSSANAVAPAVNDLETLVADCARCHGEDGMGRGDAVPVLAGQQRTYLEESLVAYAANRRESGVMTQAALDADADLFADLAAYYADLPRADMETRTAPGAELVERGRAIAMEGLPDDDIPSCDSCHARLDRNPAYPAIDGQKHHYLQTQLELFAEEKRGGTSLAETMHEFSRHLKPEDIEALAAYYSTLEPQ